MISALADTEDSTEFWHKAYHINPGQHVSGGTSFLTIGRNNNPNPWFSQ